MFVLLPRPEVLFYSLRGLIMFLCLGRVIPEFKEIKTADLGSPKIEATFTVDQTLLLLLTVSWKLQSQRLEVSHVPHSLSHSTPQHHPEVTLLLWANYSQMLWVGDLDRTQGGWLIWDFRWKNSKARKVTRLWGAGHIWRPLNSQVWPNGHCLLEHCRMASPWVSSQHGGLGLVGFFYGFGKQGGNCIAFYDLASEVTRLAPFWHT